MNTSAAWLTAAVHAGVARRRAGARRLASDAGEGVVSAAIVILIIAFLGAAMWVAFNQMWLNVKSNTCQEVGKIGNAGGSAC